MHSVQSNSDCRARKKYYELSINLTLSPRDSRMGGRRQSLLVGWSSHAIQILNSSMREFKSFIFDPSPAARSPAGRGEMLHMHVADPSPGGSRFPGGFQKQINDKHGNGPCSGPARDGRHGSSRRDGRPARVTGWAALTPRPGSKQGPTPEFSSSVCQ
jgi:hypothetical protein